MRAIIDLGTNTFHLLIAELKEGNITTHCKLQIPVKIGEGGINEGFISPQAMKRGLDALAEFRKELDRFHIGQPDAFATSAIRNARNAREFMDEALKRYRIPIRKLSGEEEAVYIYNGVRHSFAFPDEPVLVMDIGGGSVEFIIGLKETILWKQSFEIGAARLMEQFHHHDPIAPAELEALNAYLAKQLEPLRQALHQYPASILAGSAGSFETLEEVITRDLSKSVEIISEHARRLNNIEDVNLFCENMISQDVMQRKMLKGLVDFRVEMIVVAAVLMKYITDACRISSVIVSAYSLKEGILVGMADE
jgi:exopolyphosphatase/guanosine-5'-triphosphate,3'-diphosphate pyrophosphatase